MKVEAGEYRDYLKKAYMYADLRWPRNFGFAKLPDDDMKRLLHEHAPVHEATLRALCLLTSNASRSWIVYGCEDLQAPTMSFCWLQQHRI
ncbi:hypothetical protein PTKU15_83480 [Paraburkholderia terrae]|nr:hypothetical protein PTKU15_83480 [Paraburkholderia terrae]